MTLHGGGVFPEQMEAGQFTRVVGTFDVTLDESGGTQAFTLDVIDGGTPGKAPARTDPQVCRAFNESGEGDGGVYDSFLADVRALVADRSPAATSQVYQEVRARWIESPRVWWAMLAHELTMQTTDVSGDQIVGACVEYWQ
ncbi:hypothetical protein NKG05_07945 [Oerskovia sp. M15]